MAKTILFHAPVKLFGENFANRDEKVLHKMQKFEAQKPIQVNTFFQCPTNKSIDFTLDGFKYSEVSPHLMEVIS